MSRSSIYGIRKDYTGEEIFEYKNSWWFSPIIWSVLPDKYIHDYIQTPFGFKKGIIGTVSYTHLPDHCIWWEAVDMKTGCADYHATTKKFLMKQIDDD